MSDSGRPDVSVTLVLYNSDDHLRACLGALEEALRSGRAELVAVDNASPDPSATITLAAVPQARLISSAVNLGFARACNLAWPSVSGRYWLLLNPDVVLDPGALEELARWMDQHRDVAIVSPWLRAGSSVTWSGGRECEARGGGSPPARPPPPRITPAQAAAEPGPRMRSRDGSRPASPRRAGKCGGRAMRGPTP